MNVQEMHLAVRQGVDKINSLQADMLLHQEIDIELKSGNYCWTLGPSYETPAEIKDMINLGGDVVGMSTVPEIISAAELDMKVLTISCLTNFAAGITKKPLTHEDVVKTADKSSKEFSKLLIKLLYKLKI